MVIEFVGAAGAGKSYLASRLRDALLSTGLSAHVVERGSARRIDRLVAGTAASVLAARATPRDFASYTRTRAALVRYWLVRQACRPADGVWIIDEGIFQALRSFFRESRHLNMREIADRILSWIEPPDVLVAVEASLETVVDRRTRRARLEDHFTVESSRRDVALLGECVATAEHVRRARGRPLEVVHVNVDHLEVDAAVAAIAAAVVRASAPVRA